jgi:hypothetical protein
MKKRIFIIIILLSFLICALFYKREIKQLYYSYQEYIEIKNSIVWSSEKKLKLSDFSYEPEKTQMDNVAVTVGIISVHQISEKITHRSTTVFKPEKSFVTSKTDSLILRIAQARFDLCELYRRKMELKIGSLNLREIKKTNTDTITKYEELYYDLFEKKWDKFNEIEKKELNKGLIKMEKYIKKELK